MKKHNKNLEGAAKQAGVIQPVDYAIFMDHGYRGLYGGRARIFHTPRRRVGARGLQRRRALVGRVPSRGVSGCKIYGPGGRSILAPIKEA